MHRPFSFFLLHCLVLCSPIFGQQLLPSLATNTLEVATPKQLVINDSIPVNILDTLSVTSDITLAKKKFILPQKEKQVTVSPTIDMYRIFRTNHKEVFVDTTLTIRKEYRANFLRKDYFELLPFLNMGHAFNRLGNDFSTSPLIPQLGARSKHYSYFEIEDIKYYEVPTPLTELFFRTTFEQGQMADATIALNTSPQFNLAIAYRGMRSLGKYVNQRTANEVLRLSATFKTKNDRYSAKAHYISQKLDNQENGGINPDEIAAFESRDPDFDKRSVFDVRLKKAENTLKGKRTFLEHNYALAQGKDTLKAAHWSLGHRIFNESKFYSYTDNIRADYFGSTLTNRAINDKTHWAIVNNRFQTHFEQPQIGKLTAAIEFNTIDYFFPVAEDEEVVVEVDPQKLKISQTFLNADYAFRWRGFDITAHFNKTLFSDYTSDELRLESMLVFNNKAFIKAQLNFRNRTPDLNFFRYKSNYTSYNWYNPELNNEKISSLSATLSHPLLGNLQGSLQRLDSYTFFKQKLPELDPETGNPLDQLLVEVVQSPSVITYLKLRYSAHFQWRKWGLTNTLQHQQISQPNRAQDHVDLQMPEWNLRSTLSFSSDLFKKALFLQAGITGHYFSRFYANQYNPLLGDFIWQNQEQIGDYPRIDIFVNGKIQQTRIYFKYEHANAGQTKFNYYSAPGYPYRDAILRFGVIWNFFQ